jgi:predicted O-methyltransferase YrrM
LWSGKVLEKDIPENDHFTNGLRRFNDHIQADPRVENLLLPVFDGMMIIRVKP